MSKRKGSNNRIRIIGGEWRSRQLPFIEVPGLRPTPDRVRETLFNWLQGKIAGAHCLDLFSGSGAIGFEALSRYAGDIVMVEKHSRVAQQLQENIKLLEAGNEPRATIVNRDAMSYLQETTDTFDLIFLDPPYRKGLLAKSLDLILTLTVLKSGGLIYLEHEAEEQFEWSGWNLKPIKRSEAGQVVALLLEVEALSES